MVLLSVADAPGANSPGDAFKSLFGDQIRKVSATGSFLDDAKLAADIVKTARTTELPDGLLTVMYNAAFDLASRSSAGHATALEAMDRLARAVPAREIKCRQRSLGLLLRRLRKARTASQRRAAGRQYIEALRKVAGLLAKAGKLDSAVTYGRKALTVSINLKLSDVADIRAQASRLIRMRDAAKRRKSLEEKLKADPADDAARKACRNMKPDPASRRLTM